MEAKRIKKRDLKSMVERRECGRGGDTSVPKKGHVFFQASQKLSWGKGRGEGFNSNKGEERERRVTLQLEKGRFIRRGDEKWNVGGWGKGFGF